MAEDTSHPVAATTSFANATSETLRGRARELTAVWLDALEAAGSAAREEGSFTSPLSSCLLELVEAVSAALADGPGAGAGDIEPAAARAAKLHRAQGRPLEQVLAGFGALQLIVLDAVLEQACDAREPAPARLALGLAARLDDAHRRMVASAANLYRRELEEEQESQAALLAAFARSVTHGLRNRVNAARLTLSAYRFSPEEKQDELLRNLQESLEQLEDAVGGVVLVAASRRSEIGSPRRRLPEILGELRKDLEELAYARRVALRIAEPVPDVGVDAAGLQLVLLQLVGDAIQRSDRARSDGWVEIAVVAAGARGEWRVVIRDNGRTIGSAGGQRREPLARAATAASTSIEAASPAAVDRSAGCVAEEIVERLGGTLSITSLEGEGTIATFTFRAAVSPS